MRQTKKSGSEIGSYDAAWRSQTGFIPMLIDGGGYIAAACRRV